MRNNIGGDCPTRRTNRMEYVKVSPRLFQVLEKKEVKPQEQES